MRIAHRFLLLVLSGLVGCGAQPDPTTTPGESDPVAAWEAFCDHLKQSGVELLRDYPQEHAIDRNESTRYLAQQVAAAVRATLVAEQSAFPLLRLGATTIDSWGLDGADAKYTGAPLEADGRYRLSGRLGSAKLVAIQLFAMEPEYEPFAHLSNEGLQAQADGSFEVMISPERPAGWRGAWLELDPRARALLVREYFDDWENERGSELRIERLDGGGEPGVAGDPGELLGRMADAFARRAPMWLGQSSKVRRFLTNRFVARRPDENSQGLADNVYGTGWFEIGPDEALIIELAEPDALLWSFQLGNFWWESLDYVNRTGSINGSQAVVSSDGRIRLVLALEDPGVPNWLDPGGHTEGIILYRYQRARTSPEPDAKVVPVAELGRHLPDDTPSVAPGDRRREIAMRRAHAARRWAP